MSKELTSEELSERIFSIIEQYFEHPVIDKMRARQNTRNDMKAVVEKYYKELNA